MTIDQKRVLVAKSRQEFEERAAAYPDLTESKTKLLLLRERCEAAATIGKVTDRWVFHPLPTIDKVRPVPVIHILPDG
ncbi:hypothetical protein [Cupriavidus yeoncheonensis]|nr:hypothetical protein [Cupriavidus yeoncheonensis]